jgi:hypothetical protein
MSNKKSNYNIINASNKMVTGSVLLLAVVVLGIVVYWIYQAVMKSRNKDTDNPILINDVISASDSKNANLKWTLPLSSSANSPSLSYTYSFWMYIDDWSYLLNKRKIILYKGPISDLRAGLPQTSGSPLIYLDPTQNNLTIETNTYPDYSGCKVRNIPLQKWVHVVYVLDNKVSDVYINGKLERSCILQNVPKLNNNKLYLFPTVPANKLNTGYSGKLSSLRYYSNSLKPLDVAKLYNLGPYATKGATAKDTDAKSLEDQLKQQVQDAVCPPPLTVPDLGSVSS